jgi:branched-chain amino acid transport system ATP-binding protein
VHKALELRDVNVFYGSVQVIYNVNIYVGKGELVYLIGRNGAGKTTTLRSIVGLIPPRTGSIKLEGIEIARKKPFRCGMLGIGYVPDDRKIFPFLTVSENLTMFSIEPTSAKGWTLEKIYDLFPSLKRLAGNKAGNLSGGEQEMLSIARALMRNPKVLLLDEPFEGLAPVIVTGLKNVFQVIRGEVSILLVELNLKDAIRLASRCYLMDRGVIKSEHSGREGIEQILEYSLELDYKPRRDTN